MIPGATYGFDKRCKKCNNYAMNVPLKCDFKTAFKVGFKNILIM